MKKFDKIIIVLFFMFLPLISFAKGTNEDVTIRKEREFIRKGNKLYNDKRYADAEVEYKKAIGENANSQIANYNLALSLIKQSGGTNVKDENNPLKTATELLTSVAKDSRDSELRSKAFYNLGNLAYNEQQYEQSIEFYKNALRQNPEDNEARENLRLAQLKKQEQEQNQNKDNGQNKDKQDDKKEQDKQEEQNKKDENKQQQPQQPKPQEMSKENMEQILQTMQNQEKATQEKVNAKKPQNIRKTGNQW